MPLFRHFRLPGWLLLGALLPGCNPPGEVPATAATPAVAPPAAAWVPELDGYPASGWDAVRAKVQEHLQLPFGTPVPAADSRVVVRFEVAGGMVNNERIVRSLNRVADSAVLAAVHMLDFKNGPAYETPPLLCTLTVPTPGAASATQRREAVTRYLRTAERRPGEADTTFVQRVLPLSYEFPARYGDLQALACRPSAYGRQLVFTRRARSFDSHDGSYGWYNTDVFVLDPYAPDTYAVQQFHLSNFGDLPDQSVTPFAADVNHDGRPDLVMLVTYSQSEDIGNGTTGHYDYFRVQVWRTAGLDAAGRPRYREDETPYPYLEYTQDETPGPYPKEFTPATVRRLLARHWRQVARASRPAGASPQPSPARR